MHRALVLASILVIAACGKRTAPNVSEKSAKLSGDDALKDPSAKPQGYTDIYLHDVQLQEAGGITLNVRWLSGRMYQTQKGVVASLDNPQSFTLDIQDGAVAVKLAEVAKLLNTRVLNGSPVSDVKLEAQGNQIKLTGMLHKLVPLPIQVLIDTGVSPDGQQIALRIAKLDVLKIPVGGLLKFFDVKPVDLIDPQKTNGITIRGNDIVLDTAQLLPPPRNTGKLSAVHVSPQGELVEVYGSPRGEIKKIEQWRNFIRLRGGITRIGKLTMQPTDILLVDTSQDDWFTFDLTQLPEQLVSGYARLTPQAGLQMFIPDIGKIPATKANEQINVEWIKNRNVAPPADIP